MESRKVRQMLTNNLIIFAGWFFVFVPSAIILRVAYPDSCRERIERGLEVGAAVVLGLAFSDVCMYIMYRRRQKMVSG